MRQTPTTPSTTARLLRHLLIGGLNVFLPIELLL